ncbi:hypothetical protein ASF58_23325 [Methylobacterium sp. Leaf125]|uniref:hypothetical protein n=1 Tax=Methylobacterium sp. Leaf125 TaxID=1736265 RepID=UPI0006FAB5A3|nr:hypothetical protein [Methylobacterium sp. Leaf125]KQQ39075.1 hypothetical protein ASF58_23325 [Methylobacterium sp. Leaf125]
MTRISTATAALLAIIFSYVGISSAAWLLSRSFVSGSAFDFAAASVYRKLVSYYLPAVLTGAVAGWIGLSAALLIVRSASARTSAIVASAFFAILSILGLMVAGSDALSFDLASLSLARVFGIVGGFWASIQDVSRDRAPN